MKTIIITDTHFGVKNNSKIWCDYQLKFIDNTIIPLIKELKKHDEVRLIHCGDVFESRDKLNPYIVNLVLKKFEEILALCKVYILAGNHDFYSPVDDSICSIHLLFRGLKCDNLSYVTRGCIALEDTKELLLPFYSTEDDNKLEDIYNSIGFEPNIVYCHTDLDHLSPVATKLFKNSCVISGHIHTPSIHDNYYTIGSTYSLSFSDANSIRGCYVMDGQDVEGMQFIANNDSIKFWRLYDAEIFELGKYDIRNFDLIEVYINKSFLMNDEYVSQLKQLSDKYGNNIKIIPNNVKVSNGKAVIDFESYDIEQICLQYIPDKLREKFGAILKQIKP